MTVSLGETWCTSKPWSQDHKSTATGSASSFRATTRTGLARESSPPLRNTSAFWCSAGSSPRKKSQPLTTSTKSGTRTCWTASTTWRTATCSLATTSTTIPASANRTSTASLRHWTPTEAFSTNRRHRGWIWWPVPTQAVAAAASLPPQNEPGRLVPAVTHKWQLFLIRKSASPEWDALSKGATNVCSWINSRWAPYPIWVWNSLRILISPCEFRQPYVCLFGTYVKCGSACIILQNYS